MRKKVIAMTIAVACGVAATLYFSPTTIERARHIFPGRTALSDQTATGGGAARGIAVTSATATVRDFPIRRYAIGFVASPAVTEINARIASQVVSIAVKDGQMVKAGDLLISLDDRALKAEVDRDKALLAKDQALLVSAGADMARAKDLAVKQAGTEQAYDEALAAEKAASATVDGDEAQLDANTVQLGFTSITAPIAGRLGAVSVSIGDLVAPANGGTQVAPLVTITQMDPLRVNFSLPERDLPTLQKALAAPSTSSVTLRRDSNPDPVATGRLDFVDSGVDTASGTIAARATVPNPDLSLWPGQYVDVVLQAGTMPHMVSVPTVAVQPSQKGPFVYVIKPDNTVEMRPVEVALTEGENSAIGSGLRSGERVVTEGQARLRDGAAVREVQESAAGSGKTSDNAAVVRTPGRGGGQ